ncbi:MAG: E3 binding domain-containing protein, partial [Thiobacillaceae bacterium]|nr:E3 binding domain-containing protein [Thiobacillaceae bacterium]
MSIKEVLVPDIGNFKDVEVIEVMVNVGDSIRADEGLITVESDKAAMDIPAPFAGTVKELKIKVGDKVSEGSLILTLEAAVEAKAAAAPPVVTAFTPPAAEVAATVPPPSHPAPEVPAPIQPKGRPDPIGARPEFAAGKSAHASPSVRRFARELGIHPGGADLSLIKGSGPRGRILKEDVQAWVKGELAKPKAEAMGVGAGLAVIPAPVVDFTRFGEIDTQPLSRIKKLSGANLHRNWVTAPHVTQFDEADITDLEDFRKSMLDEAAK